MPTIRAFIDAVRGVQCLPPLATASAGDLRGGVQGCDSLLERALACRIDVAGDPPGRGEGCWVMCFADEWDAALISLITDLQRWPSLAEVVLPEETDGLVISDEFGLVSATDAGALAGWWEPIDQRDALFSFHTIDEPVTLGPAHVLSAGREG